MKRYLIPFIVLAFAVPQIHAEDQADLKNMESFVDQLVNGETEDQRDAARELGDLGISHESVIKALSDAVRSRDYQIRGNAMVSLASFGKDAAPAIENLIDRLDGSDQDQYRAAYALGRIGADAFPVLLRELDETSSSKKQIGLIQALGWIGPNAEPAVPSLIKFLGEDQERSDYAVEALWKIGSLSISGLIEATASDSEQVRSRALLALSQIPDARGQLERIVERLEDSSATVRTAAVRTYGELAPDSVDAVSHLLPMLSDSDVSVREEAVAAIVRKRKSRYAAVAKITELLNAKKTGSDSLAYLLGQIGPAAAPATDSILAAFGIDKATDQELATALGKIGPSTIEAMLSAIAAETISFEVLKPAITYMSDSATPKLLEQLDGKDASVQAAAAKLLGVTESASPETVQALMERLDSQSEAVRIACAQGLAQMGESAKSAENALQQALKSENPKLQAAALDALFQIGVDPRTLTDHLVAGIRHQDLAVRLQSARTFGRIESVPQEQADALVESLADGNAELRRFSMLALGNAEELNEKTVKAIEALLSDDDLTVRQTTLATLGKLKTATSAGVEELISMVRDAEVRNSTIETLGNIGSAANAAVPTLIELLSNDDSEIRSLAIRSLSTTQTDKDKLVAILTESLSDSDWGVRKQSAKHLGDLGEDAIAAVPTLISMFENRDDSDFVREALQSIDAAPPEAVPLLVDLLKRNRSRRARFYAIFLLKKVGPAAKAAIPALKEIAEDPDLSDRSRRYLYDAIEEIEEMADNAS